MGLPLLTTTLDEAQKLVTSFMEIWNNVPQPGQIRLLVAEGLPTCPVQLIERSVAPTWTDKGAYWLVERLDTGEKLYAARSALKRQMSEMEVLAWAAKTPET